MKKIKVFLASSNELKDEREDLSARMSTTGSQSEYNNHVKAADLFVLLAYTKVGMYTAEEFETAFGQFQSTKKPFIFTYFKTPEHAITESSLDKFQQKLKCLKHFYSSFKDSNDLWVQFNTELDRLKTNRFTEFDRHTADEKFIVDNQNAKIKNQFNGGTFDKTTFN